MDDDTLKRITNRITDYNAKLEGIREDRDLSDHGRRKKIVELYDKTVAERDRLVGDDGTRTASRRQALHQRLFGVGAAAGASEVISYRDAQDRVEGVKNAEDLGNLMERAASIGDTSLLKAGFAVAFERSRNSVNGGGYEGIVGEYVEQFPDVGEDVQEYQALTSSRALTATLAERMATSVPRPPEYDDRTPLSDEQPKESAGDAMRRMLASSSPGGPRYQGDFDPHAGY